MIALLEVSRLSNMRPGFVVVINFVLNSKLLLRMISQDKFLTLYHTKSKF